AAQAQLQAGEFDAALTSLARAADGPLDELQRAQLAVLRGHVTFASNAGREAPALLLQAAQQLEHLDIELACDTYLDALAAAMFAGSYAGNADFDEVSRAARAAAPPTATARPQDLLLVALAVHATEGLAAAAPLLRHAGQSIADAELTVGEG